MKFFINKVFIPELQKAASVASVKTSVFATRYLRLKAEGNILYISACNFEIGYETEIKTNIDEEGKTAVEAERFLSILKSYPEDAVPVEVIDRTMHIGRGNVSFSIKTMEYEDVPEPTTIDNPEHSLSFDKEKLLSSMNIAKSIEGNKDNARPFTNMVFFRKTDGGYNILSTDSKRMTSCFLECRDDGPEEFNIPKTAVSTIVSNCDGRIFLQGNDVGFKTDGKLSVKQLEGGFPSVDQLIKTEPRFKFDLNRKKLLDSLKRCNIVVSDFPTVRLEASKGKLFLSASDPEYGDFTEEIELSENLEFETAVNSRFLLQAVQHATEDSLKIGITDNQNPMYIYSETTFVIMPVKI